MWISGKALADQFGGKSSDSAIEDTRRRIHHDAPEVNTLLGVTSAGSSLYPRRSVKIHLSCQLGGYEAVFHIWETLVLALRFYA